MTTKLHQCRICNIVLDRFTFDTTQAGEKRIVNLPLNDFNYPHDESHCEQCYRKYHTEKDFNNLNNQNIGAGWKDTYNFNGTHKKSFITRPTIINSKQSTKLWN